MRILEEIAADRRIAVALGGAAAVVAGSLMAWARTELLVTETVERGTAATGKVTVVLGVAAIVLILACASLGHRDLAAGAALLGLACFALVLAYRMDLDAAAARAVGVTGFDGPVRVRIGSGWWVTAAGGLACAGAAAARALGRRAGTAIGESAATPDGAPGDLDDGARGDLVGDTRGDLVEGARGDLDDDAPGDLDDGAPGGARP